MKGIDIGEKHWAVIWHQALTGSFLKGKAFGWNKTVVFNIKSPAAGSALRLQFGNRQGNAPYEIGAARLFAGGQDRAVRMDGKESFLIPVGGIYRSDPCEISVAPGEDIEIRLYYTNAILDSNMIEEDANLLPGDQTAGKGHERLKKPFLAKLLGAYNAIPAIEAVEMLTEAPLKAIVAFGDSITALSRWTKPLSDRLAKAFPGEYALLNSGISGNCLLYEPEGTFAPVFGDKGTARFSRDVLDIPGLQTVILGLGVNDASYLSEKTAGLLSLESYRKAMTEITDALHTRGVRVVVQTVTPRLGVARTMGKYTKEMEDLRLQYNDWIRNAGIFDYVFDAEAVVREEHPDGFYYAEGLHQGDHLHPNEAGGRKLADAFDLDKLTGKES